MATRDASEKPLRPHRCNDRLEDAIQGLFEGSPSVNFFPLVALFRACLASEAGQEPTAPFRFVTPLPPGAVPSRRPGVAQREVAAVQESAGAGVDAGVAPAEKLRKDGWRSLWRTRQ